MTILNYAKSRSRSIADWRRFGSMVMSRERVTNRRAKVANLHRMKCQVEPRAHLSPDRVRRKSAPNESLDFRFRACGNDNCERRAQRQLTIKYFTIFASASARRCRSASPSGFPDSCLPFLCVRKCDLPRIMIENRLRRNRLKARNGQNLTGLH